ncbi:MAG: hypothetical protein QOC62_6170, partial [Mycobacterium sp.]|nr:hypothetical protein [Mycobacterium sp.]
WTPPSAEPNGVSTPTPVPPDAEAVGAGSAGGGGGAGSVGRPAPKPVWTPPSAEPNGVSTPTPVPPNAEAVGAGSAGGGGGAGNCGPVTSNPASPRPEASAPVVSASAPPAPASEKASAAATVLVIFKDVRTVDSGNNMSPLSVVGFGATPHGTVTRSVIERMSPRWPGSHQGKAGADNGWRKPRSKTVSRTPVPDGKKSPSHRVPMLPGVIGYDPERGTGAVCFG